MSGRAPHPHDEGVRREHGQQDPRPRRERLLAARASSEAFISRFARIYTPAVCGSALALAVIPPLVRMLGMGLDGDWGTWVYRALTFLVASCPCALVISIPLSFFAGIGGASKAGVLVKGSNYLETLSKTRIVVFDKTGTLTKGVFEVNGIHHSPYSAAELVEFAALAESASSHPISRSLQAAYGREIDRSRVSGIREISGEGVTATVDGHCRRRRQRQADGRAGRRLHKVPQRRHHNPHGHRRQIRRPYRHKRRDKAALLRGRERAQGRRSARDGHAHRGLEARRGVRRRGARHRPRIRRAHAQRQGRQGRGAHRLESPRGRSSPSSATA